MENMYINVLLFLKNNKPKLRKRSSPCHIKVVKILKNDDGDAIDNPKWCLNAGGINGDATLCSGEYFGCGEGTAEYEEKIVERDGVTCEQCLQKIRFFKKLKIRRN